MWLTAMVILALFSTAASPVSGLPQTSSRTATLPDSPCDLLTPTQMAVIAGVEVTAVQRVPSIAKIVRAQQDNREPGPGTICRYETRSDFGAITIAVLPRSERATAKYWADRSRYFETYRGSAQSISRLGMDAWLAGEVRLHVLIRQDEYFTVMTQMYQRQSRELLVTIARAVLDRF